jgi:hypothetical protein
MSSTPTLFNSGTLRPQLSSCYLTTVADDLDGIYEAIKENALLAKYAGGLGNDWTPVRALGSHIKGTNGKSQGVVPFLKVVNDTAVAVNQGGKRKGAVCAYLETWHLDIEEFLDLRKNTGDDRRRTHDMNTANWIPDLFMKRVMENANGRCSRRPTARTCTTSSAAPSRKPTCATKQRPRAGEIKLFKKIPAVQLWRKMLTMLFETGHPWITFKDPCNLRSPQQHVGVVHSSNLCTEITLNTNDTEIAVCNLGSVNLVAHLSEDDGQGNKVSTTTSCAHRPHRDAHARQRHRHQLLRGRQGAQRNLKHRPVGMGIMGFQDCLHELRTPYASDEAVEFADRSMEASLLRLLGLDRTGRRARPLRQLQGQPVGPRHPAARLARHAGRAARRLPRSGPLGHDGLGRAAQPHRELRHAQLQLPRHRADRHHFQHHRRRCQHRADLPEPVRQVEPVGRIHRGERAPGARPEEDGPVGRSHGRRPEVLRRLAVAHRPHSGRAAQPVRHRLRSRTEVAGRSRIASPEVDRPGAEPEHLHGRRIGQEARRNLQTGLAARPEDHLLPARHGRHARREVHRPRRRAERGVERSRTQVLRHRRPDCEACQ